MANKVIFAFLALLLLLPALHAEEVSNWWKRQANEIAGVAGSGSRVYFSADDCKDPYASAYKAPILSFWMVVVGISLAMSVFIAGLAYMVGHGLQNPGGIAWAKDSLWQVAVSALVVIFFLFANKAVDDVSTIFVHPAEGKIAGSTMQAAMDFVRSIGGTIALDLAALTAFINVPMAMLGNLSIQLAPGGLAGVTFQTGYMFRPVLDLLNMIIVLLTTVFGEWFIHMFLLCFSNKYMLSIIMPVGIFLRTFPFTRALGGGLIAVAIGFYTVYPAMMVVSGLAVQEKFQFVDADGNPCGSGSWTDCFLKTHMSSKFFEDLMATALGGTSAITIAAYLATFLNSTAALATGVFSLMVLAVVSLLTDVAYFVVVVGILLPIINLFATFTFIREVAQMLGTDVNIGSLLRVL